MSIEQPTSPPDGDPPHRRSRSAIVVALVAIVIVALFGATLALRGRAPTVTAGGRSSVLTPTNAATPTNALTPTVPAGWVQYTDPDGYFSLWMPPNWTVSRSVGSATEGDNTGSATFPTVSTQVGEASSDGAAVSIYIQEYTSDFTRHLTCKAEADPAFSFKTNTTLAGLPAYFDNNSMWILEAQNAHFQIDFRYPGSPYENPGGPVILPTDPTATPIPAGIAQVDQPLVEAVIASFHPIPDQPLTCN